jgi:hypothetical protein
MDLWATRKASLKLLESELTEQQSSLEMAFEIIDASIDFFNEHAANDQYSRICGLTLAKARSYALGAYGMILDNLGQEAGALMRPFLEYYELLIYFAEEPNRVEQAAEDKLPTAGKRAQLINSDFKGFREYLNENASHSSYSFYSLRHQLDSESLLVKPAQQFAPKVLFRNLGDFFAQLILLCFQAAICVSIKDYESGFKLSQEAGQLRDEGGALFQLKERLDSEYEPKQP